MSKVNLREAVCRVSVIIVSYNGLQETTRPCLEQLFCVTDYPDYEVVVVDNSSTDGTQNFLIELAKSEKRLVHVLNTHNRGFAGGNNDGIKVATGDILVLLNNDTLVTPGWLDKLSAPLIADERIGMIGPVSNSVGNEQQIYTQGTTTDEILRCGLRWAQAGPGELFECERLGFFCVAIRKDVVEEVGGLDEEFGLGYYEDDDYCYRVRLAGYRLYCREDVFIYHRGSASFRKISSTSRQLLLKNKRLLEKKHGICYQVRHLRDRQLDLVEHYLGRLEADGYNEGLWFRVKNRLRMAGTVLPHGLLKKYRYKRRIASLTRRGDRWIEFGGNYTSLYE